ncbi:hypothetical protein BU25DRAFT_483617 [Macroventuria anomochaeta]|uniref:Uncharacterized protein n=1 Tax=Macroventuria anomochaeta TaxID=301207 RepID=A0ACB6S9U4_9PLEO|nr:uncharacterized protein BU25DRAFT_483617 [Macroventuria anomochaeta]KAF2630813.1 hypothetical protein BU25DRAFT_483617 [Macroventuria anomochaeta]
MASPLACARITIYRRVIFQVYRRGSGWLCSLVSNNTMTKSGGGLGHLGVQCAEALAVERRRYRCTRRGPRVDKEGWCGRSHRRAEGATRKWLSRSTPFGDAKNAMRTGMCNYKDARRPSFRPRSPTLSSCPSRNSSCAISASEALSSPHSKKCVRFCKL